MTKKWGLEIEEILFKSNTCLGPIPNNCCDDVVMHIKAFKNNKSPYLAHKVCPHCGETNEKSAIHCGGCGKNIVFRYGDDVCLNCGHMGRMKKKYALKYDGLIGLLFLGGTILPTHRGAMIGKICRKCKREIRESDYEIA